MEDAKGFCRLHEKHKKILALRLRYQTGWGTFTPETSGLCLWEI